MENTLALLCDYAMVSQEGKLSILGIFDRVNPPRLPGLVPSMFVVTSWKAEDDERAATKQFRIAVAQPDGNELVKAEFSVVVPPDAPEPIRINHILGLAGLLLPSEGRYSVRVFVDDEQEVEIALDVDQAQ
jgi:hypothetical protein